MPMSVEERVSIISFIVAVCVYEKVAKRIANDCFAKGGTDCTFLLHWLNKMLING